MTREDVIRMAREAGFLIGGVQEFVFAPSSLHFTGELSAFATLVAAAEREECAQVAERMLRYYTQAVTGVPEAIRARGKE